MQGMGARSMVDEIERGISAGPEKPAELEGIRLQRRGIHLPEGREGSLLPPLEAHNQTERNLRIRRSARWAGATGSVALTELIFARHVGTLRLTERQSRQHFDQSDRSRARSSPVKGINRVARTKAACDAHAIRDRGLLNRVIVGWILRQALAFKANGGYG